MQRTSLALAGLVALALGVACGGEPAPPEAAAPAPSQALAKIGPGPHDVAVVDMGPLGVLKIELLPEIAPKTVALFVRLANEGFYDGTNFHRVIPDFMIQGGDPLSRDDNDPRNDGKGGASLVEDEFNDYPHLRGTVSLANTGYRNSGGSQFFIVHGDSPGLDGSYSAFGRVIEGMQVVDAVTQLELDLYGRYGPKNRPYPVDAKIRSIRIQPVGESVASREP